MEITAPKDNVKIVTGNDFITARGLEKLQLVERKLLYLAIAQIRKDDTEFKEYSITAKKFAEIMGIDSSNIYREAEQVAYALSTTLISWKKGTGKNEVTALYPLFCRIEYSRSMITFELNEKLKEILLQLTQNFSQPLLKDFLQMNSPYSMAIWHLFQREMHSRKPEPGKRIEFELSIEEIRAVTCGAKFADMGSFKRYVLNKAIREIRDNCSVIITYTNIRTGRFVTNLHFTAENEYVIDSIKPRRVRKHPDPVVDAEPQISAQGIKYIDCDAPKTKNRFNQFPQRQYDMDDLEKKLLRVQENIADSKNHEKN